MPSLRERRWRTVCVFPVPGGAVQQDAPLEVLAQSAQVLARLGHLHHMPGYPCQDPGGKDHVAGCHLRALVEGHPGTGGAELLHGERNHLSLQHALGAHSLPKRGQEAGHRVRLGRQNFQHGRSLSEAGICRPDQHRERVSVAAEQAHAEGQCLPLLRGSDGQVGVVRLAYREASVLRSVLQDVAQRHVVALIAAADSDQPALRVLAGEGRQDDVGVRQPVPRDLLHDGRQVADVGF